MRWLAALAALLAAATAAPIERGDLRGALTRALADEQKAIATYEAVIERHGDRRPFTNIVEAERRHSAELLAQFERLGIAPDGNALAFEVPEIPADFSDTCDMAEFAEIENVRMYDELIAETDDEQVRAVFERLRAASAERHLPAFRRHGNGWHVVTDAPSEGQQAKVDRAKTSRDALFGELFRRLGGEIARNGHAGAITVCNEAAPELAAAVAAEHGVRIGRTSWKLRNPKNTGPGWMALVDGRPEEPVVLADRTGRVGYVSPIRLMNLCTACHGDPAKIAPDVRARLDELYPDDRATGFAPGELRGWFWVEVPAGTD